jgi:DNA repair protein RadC
MRENILSEIKKLEQRDHEWILNQLQGLVMESKKISTPADIYSKYLLKYSNKKQEHFIVIELDGGNKVQKCRVITKGLLNSSQVHPGDVLRVNGQALKESLKLIIIGDDVYFNYSGNIWKYNFTTGMVTNFYIGTGEIRSW